MSWRRHTTRVFCYLNWKSLIEVWIAVLTLTTHIAAAHRSSAYYDFSIFVFNFIHDSLSIEKINVFIYASTEHVYFSHYDLSREKKQRGDSVNGKYFLRWTGFKYRWNERRSLIVFRFFHIFFYTALLTQSDLYSYTFMVFSKEVFRCLSHFPRMLIILTFPIKSRHCDDHKVEYKFFLRLEPIKNF